MKSKEREKTIAIRTGRASQIICILKIKIRELQLFVALVIHFLPSSPNVCDV